MRSASSEAGRAFEPSQHQVPPSQGWTGCGLRPTSTSRKRCWIVEVDAVSGCGN
jgi:hypothetical protein